jgi:mono/diheme cytochrome c family protein
VLIALTAGQMLGLAIVAAVFIVFAVLSSFVLPRRNPDFPGPERVKLFSLVSVGLALAMIGAMFFLAVEAHEEAQPEAATETVGDLAETEPPAGGGAEGVEGDAEAGAEVFADAGCGACHALDAAGATGTLVDLDEAQPSFQEAVDTVTNGRGAMPAFRDQLSAEQIRDVARFVVEASGGGE